MIRIAILILIIFRTVLLFSQTLSGVVKDAETDAPIKNVQINIKGIIKFTDENGNFIYTKEEISSGENLLKINAPDFQEEEISVNIRGEDVKLEIKLNSILSKAEIGVTEILQEELDYEEENKNQTVSPLLGASGDVFVANAGYMFNTMRFRTRGYDGDFTPIYINGIFINDAESGFASWSEWGGLNDVTRNKEYTIGIEPSSFSFGGLNGVTNIITRASKQRKQTKLSYSLSNRTYQHRIMLTYSSGLLDNNWAITLSCSKRYGTQGYVKGTFYDSYSCFLALERKINEKHSLALTTYVVPTIMGMQAPSTNEAYTLLNDNYYNPNWGYHNGKIRNARVKRFTEPNVMLNYYFEPTRYTRLTTSLAYSMGKNGISSLNWYDAPDPRPDYYKYLPSYQNSEDLKNYVKEYWISDVNNHQINWEKIYYINYLSTLEGKQSKYIIEERRNDHQQFSANILLNHSIDNNIKVDGGIELRKYTGYHFKEIKDLLGGNYWLDIDQYAERDFPSDTLILQNDLNNPYRKVKEGDKFGYDYEIRQNYSTIWTSAIITYDNLDAYFAVSGYFNSFNRKGNMKNGRYPNNSFGESEWKTFFNYGIKNGVTYKINGRNYISVNSMYLTVAPDIRNCFISPKIRHDLVKDLKEEKIMSFDINYKFSYPIIKGRLTYFQTYIYDQLQLYGGYHDYYRTYVNMIMNNVNKIHQGIEGGIETKLTKELSFILVSSLGNYQYIAPDEKRPQLTISFENASQPDTTLVVYNKNFYIPNSPQNAIAAGLKYRHPTNIFLNVNFNYFDKTYLDFNPLRRTTMAIYMLTENDPRIKEITQQEKLPSGYTIDASLGKTFRIKYNSHTFFISLNISVNNILDNKELISGGYEQIRFDFENKNVSKFPPKYFYAFGRTYFINLSCRI